MEMTYLKYHKCQLRMTNLGTRPSHRRGVLGFSILHSHEVVHMHGRWAACVLFSWSKHVIHARVASSSTHASHPAAATAATHRRWRSCKDRINQSIFVMHTWRCCYFFWRFFFLYSNFVWRKCSLRLFKYEQISLAHCCKVLYSSPVFMKYFLLLFGLAWIYCQFQSKSSRQCEEQKKQILKHNRGANTIQQSTREDQLGTKPLMKLVYKFCCNAVKN